MISKLSIMTGIIGQSRKAELSEKNFLKTKKVEAKQAFKMKTIL